LGEIEAGMNGTNKPQKDQACLQRLTVTLFL
jgi:hypothetical protein